MPIETIVPRRLYRQVAEQLRQLFDSGEFAVGDRLPPERELAERMGISRPTIREALIALEVEGRVRIRVGSGIYVTEPSRIPANPTTDEGPFELLRAREFVEGAVAEEAARLATPADIAALDDILARMEGQGASQPHHDRARPGVPHDHRLDPRQCRAGARYRRSVRPAHEPFFERLSSYFEDPTTWDAALQEHRLVRDGIAARDPKAAKQAMQDHLRKSQERFSISFGTWRRWRLHRRAKGRRFGHAV